VFTDKQIPALEDQINRQTEEKSYKMQNLKIFLPLYRTFTLNTGNNAASQSVNCDMCTRSVTSHVDATLTGRRNLRRRPRIMTSIACEKVLHDFHPGDVY
jgi:hypothetical protein